MATNESFEKIRKKYPVRLTRGRAIKLYCKEQCCGDMESWKNCNISSCFLWNFRLGKETLAKPKSFKKQRKTISNFTKSSIPETNQTPSNQNEVKNDN